MRIDRYLILLVLLITQCEKPSSSQLTIAVASNMQYAMLELTENFESISGLSCEMVVSSSGKLTAQVMQGAPFDLLVSADIKYPDTLYITGYATEKPQIYAYGKLVLWTVSDNIPLDLDSLHITKIKHIALANPKTAPYGSAAMEIINELNHRNMVFDKLVYAESISQASQFVLSKVAEIGFTAKSVVLSPTLEHKSRWVELDGYPNSLIAQSAALLNNGKQPQARKFLDFLLSPEGQNILKKYGYETGSQH